MPTEKPNDTNKSLTNITDLGKKEEVSTRRVSFASKNKMRTFENPTETSTDYESSPEPPQEDEENPFRINERSSKKTKTHKASPLVKRVSDAMEMTTNVGTILKNSNRDFVEQSSPILSHNEPVSRLSWYLNENESKTINNNIEKIIADDNFSDNTETITNDIKDKDIFINDKTETIQNDKDLKGTSINIKDFPTPEFKVINSPNERKDSNRASLSNLFSDNTTNTRLSYPAPLFPRQSISETHIAPSPCLIAPTPDIPIKDFLSEIGIRFLDGLVSFTRRDTLLIDKKDPEDISDVAKIKSSVISATEQRVYEEICCSISDKIKTTREEALNLEGEFGFNKPLIYLQYQKATEVERDNIKDNLKSLKTKVRAKAKEHWDRIQYNFYEKLINAFQEELKWVLSSDEEFKNAIPVIEHKSSLTIRLHQELTDEVNKLREKTEALETMDWARYRELEKLIEKGEEDVSEIKKKITESEKDISEKEKRIQAISTEEIEIEREIDKWTRILRQHEEPMSSLVRRCTKVYDTLSILSGWTLRCLTERFFVCSFMGDVPITVRMEYNTDHICLSVEITSAHSDSFTVKCIDFLLENKATYLLGKSVSGCIKEIGRNIVRWVDLREDLRKVRLMARLSCDDSGKSLERHCYKVSILNRDIKTRFDVLFDATEYPSIKITKMEFKYGKELTDERINEIKTLTEMKGPNSYNSLSTLVTLLKSQS
eukprot:GHVP01028703.1.p1 GENE.GHVP01028703.1~~GHVP01028703.1.p1  ORF type:complete len:716 (-),score=151.32 GHVP01028703.1:13-2160(-)